MGANRMGPPCPNCGSQITDVGSTYRSKEGDFVRRRICIACDHRFYTAQCAEVLVSRRDLQWKGRVPTLLKEDIRDMFHALLQQRSA